MFTALARAYGEMLSIVTLAPRPVGGRSERAEDSTTRQGPAEPVAAKSLDALADAHPKEDVMATLSSYKAIHLAHARRVGGTFWVVVRGLIATIATGARDPPLGERARGLERPHVARYRRDPGRHRAHDPVRADVSCRTVIRCREYIMQFLEYSRHV